MLRSSSVAGGSPTNAELTISEFNECDSHGLTVERSKQNKKEEKSRTSEYNIQYERQVPCSHHRIILLYWTLFLLLLQTAWADVYGAVPEFMHYHGLATRFKLTQDLKDHWETDLIGSVGFPANLLICHQPPTQYFWGNTAGNDLACSQNHI
jgi:hypothetical protein